VRKRIEKSITESTVLITGTVRNGGKQLEKDLGRLLRATRQFKKQFTFIVESDSSDRTPQLLSKLEDKFPNLRFAVSGNLASTMPLRTERIAHCRNFCLEEIRVNPLYAEAQYIVVADLDGMQSHLTQKNFKSCWAMQENWDVVTANQADFYYDIWALRHKTWCPGDCWREYQDLTPIIGKSAALDLCIAARQIHLKPDAPSIEVESAFGGLAIYKREAFLAGGYEGLRVDGSEICEHVPHHTKIRAAGYRIFINPKLINTDRAEHVIHPRRKNLWKLFKS